MFNPSRYKLTSIFAFFWFVWIVCFGLFTSVSANAKPMPADEIPDWLSNYTPYKEWLQSDQINYSVKEKKIQLLQLAINHWYKKFENKVLELDEDEQSWPIADHTNCHIGSWIQRAKQDPQFDLSWVNILDKKHISMHNMAENILNEYQLGNKDDAINELKKLKKTFMQITSILDEAIHSDFHST